MNNNEFLEDSIPERQPKRQNVYVPDVDLTVNTDLTDGTEIDYATKTQLGANKGSFLGLNRGEEPSKSIFGIGSVPFKKIMELATSGVRGSELGGVVIGNQMKNFYKMAVSEIALYNTLNPKNQKKLLSQQFINDEINEEEYLKELDSLEKNYARLKDMYKTEVGQELLADQQYIEEKFGKILKPAGEDKVNRFAFDLGAGAVSYIGSIGSFLLFKNPSLSIAMLSIPEGMQAYNKAIEAGKRGGEAQKIGAEEFSWIAVTEYLGTKALFSILNRNGVLSKYAQNVFKKSPVFAKTASAVATEGGQEAIQDAGSDVLYNIHDIADYSLLDIVKDSLYSFLIGGALGGLTGGLKGIYDWRKVYKSEVGRIYALRNEDGSYKYSLDEAKQIAKTTVSEAFSQDLVHEVIGLTKKERENFLAQKAQEDATKQIQKNFENKMASLNASRNIIYRELSVVDKKVKNQAQKLGIDENSAEMMSQMVQNLSKLYFNAFGITPLEYYGMHQIDIKIDNGKIYVDNRDTGKSVLFDEAVATRGILNNNIRQIALATKCSENINDLVKLTQKLVKEGVVSQAQINNMFIKFGEQARNIPKLQDIVAKVQDDYVAELLGDDSFNVEELDEQTRQEEEEKRRKENEALEAELKAIQEYENSPQYKRDINRMKKDMLDSAIEYLMNGSNGNGFVVRIPTKNISPDRIGEYKALSDKMKRTFFSSKSSITYDQLESWIREKYGLENFDLFKYLSDLETRMNNVEVFRQGERGAVTMPTARIRWYQKHTKIIELLQSADKTTLLHELSHVYLRELEILRNNRGRSNPDLDETFRVLDKWLGEPTNGQYTKAQQEKFAKGFESYLATGKTPNSALAGVFEKVREWFKEVYYNARYLVDLSPEVEMMFRGMFNVNLEREALESFMRRPESKILNTPVEMSSRYNQDAWHGTPHDFNRFSTRKIGTGQGARVHGWGLYFAKNRQLSEQYREELTRELYGNQTLYFDEEKLAEEYDKLEELATKQQPSAIRDTMYDRLAFLEDLLILHDEQEVIDRGYHKQKVIEWFDKNIKDKVINKNRKTGQLFKVDIPENEELLDEQKKIKDQPKSIQEKLRKLYKGEKWIDDELFTLNKDFEEITGEELYSILVDQGGTDNQDNDKEASLLLNKYGIKGITYDGHQDGRGFVVFDKKAINILEKYYQSKKDETQQETEDPSILTRDNTDTFFQDEVDDVIDPNYGEELKKTKPKSNERAVADLIQPLSSQVGKIVRAGEGLLRIYEAKLSIHKQEYLDVAQDFLRKTKRLKKQNRKDWYIFSKAVYNGDGEMIEKVLKKYPYLREGYDKVRDLLDNKIKDELRNVGVDVDSFTDRIYYPRKVDDIKGLIGFLRKNEMWSEIERAMEEKDKDWEKNWSDDAKADFINKWLKGYTNTKITNTSDNTKQRKIDELTDEMMRYYKNINDSLIDYLSAQNNLIETAKFLGVKKEQLAEVTGPNGVTNTKKMVDIIEGELTKVVRKLVENKEISYEQEEKLRELLKARFNFQNSPAWVSLLKSLAFLSSLNNVTTALTQLGDLAWAFRVSIPYTLKNIPKAFFDKAKLSMRRHLGLDDPTQELTDTRLTNLQIVNRALSVVLGPFFSRIDKLGKNTYINTVYDKYRKMIKTKKGEQKLYEQFEELYGKDYADLFINALKQDEVTEDIALLAFAELAKVQPVALSEMPREYLESPKGRMFYALKTFTIKQLDTVYTQSIRKIRRGMEEENSELVGEGVADMALYMFFFFILTSSKDVLRDILFNRELDFTDIMFDNLLSLFGITKYAIYNGREYNIENFWHSLVDFPLINQAIRFNSDIQKVAKGKKGIKDLSIWRNAIPLFGDFYDEYYGGAKERKDKKKKKKETKQRPIKGFVF